MAQSRTTVRPPTSLLLSSLLRLTKSILPQQRLDNLAFSSQQCASWRAIETNRPDPLFNDPFAERLAGPEAMSRAQARGEPLYPRISVRTRYFDDFANSALAGRPQLVLLGAGMDMRAYRLEAVTEHTRVFEIDTSSVIDLKEELLATVRPSPTSRASVTRVRADVTGEWAEKLLEAGFECHAQTVWLVEGLIYYLTEEQNDALFSDVFRLSAVDSTMCFSAVTKLREQRQGLASMFKSAVPDPEAFVQRFGFRFDRVAELGGPDASYGRWPSRQEIRSKEGLGATVYVSATKA